MALKSDRRQARTRQLLHQALLELIREKGTETVTVTDVAKRANVNRGTFYLHYRDVPDMMDKMFEDVFRQIQSRTVAVDPRQIVLCGRRNEPLPVFVELLNLLKSHAKLITVLLDSSAGLNYVRRFRKPVLEHVFSKFERILPGDLPSRVPKEYVVYYVVSANMGTILNWVETGMKLSPYELALMLTKIMTHGPLVSSGVMDTDFSAVPPPGD